jgi:hypothetical protein
MWSIESELAQQGNNVASIFSIEQQAKNGTSITHGMILNK